ncbi:MAG: hypothetical protein AAF828_04760, partial [Bacteroidota bacterium]
MQVLYAAQREENASTRHHEQMYLKLVDRSFKLYLQNLLIIQRVAEYAKQDEAMRRNKHLPSEEDKAFTTKLAHNPSIQSLSSNQELTLLYNKQHIGRTIDADQISTLYRDLLKTEEYQAYLSKADSNEEDDRLLLLFLYKWLQGHELFLTMVEDHFPLWEENKSLIIGAVKKTIKAMPLTTDFYQKYQSPSETVTEFGHTLLRHAVEGNEALLEQIKPVLKNWDVERVATIDMILIKMALVEFL